MTTTNPHVTIVTNRGNIEIELFVKDAPKTVENFLKLAKAGFYHGTKFHRIIPDFMIQGGDPNSKGTNKNTWGTGGPGYQFADEFNTQKLVRGSLAMANSGPNTNGSQFFMVTADATPWLDGKHTNFGRVVGNEDVIKNIGTVATDAGDHPMTDVVVERMEVQE